MMFAFHGDGGGGGGGGWSVMVGGHPAVRMLSNDGSPGGKRRHGGC